MAAVYKRPSSPFWYYDTPDPDAPNGRRRKSTKRIKKSEAVEVARATEKKILDRIQLGREVATLAEGAERYLRHTMGAADHLNIRGRVNKLLGRLKGQPDRFKLNPEMLFHDLTMRHVNDLRSARREEGNAPRTINHEIATLRAIHYLLKSEGVCVSPTIAFPLTKVAGKLRWLSPDEVRRLLVELDPGKTFGTHKGAKGYTPGLGSTVLRQRQDCSDLVLFLLDTGCRYSEAGNIPWAAIDTEAWRWADIYRTKTKNSSLLPLSSRLKEVLQRRYAARGDSAYVFPGYKEDGADRPRTKSTQAIRHAMDRAGLNSPDLVARFGRTTVHTLRDTFASWLVQSGVSLFKVQRLLGHSSPVMTMKYAKLEMSALVDETAATLDQIAADHARLAPDARGENVIAFSRRSSAAS
ncbi:MAG TPA: site-specific integrase [Stellaceae bacterium]|jgi:integrase|nr:site-specific integrase [Stellaceae bacterium]